MFVKISWLVRPINIISLAMAYVFWQYVAMQPERSNPVSAHPFESKNIRSIQDPKM